MNDQIYTTAKRPNTDLRQQTNEYYTYVGGEDFVDENNNCRLNEDNENTLAKKIFRDNGTFRLMIKCDMDHKPVDPENQIATSINKIREQYKSKSSFVTVSNKAFDNYLKFLQTKNKSWLLNTEREMI